MYKYFISLFILLFSVLSSARTMEDPQKVEIGFEEKLGEYVPMDITLTDEYGKSIKLKDLINGKPTIISLVYYRCPSICSPLLNGLVQTVDILDYEPSKDYSLITISFDFREDYILASEKKKSYYNQFEKKKLTRDAWRFLTSDSVNIARITDAVGFRFKQEGNDFAHGAGIIAISPEGKIVRYLYGIEFLPFDMKMSIIEASEGRVGTSIAKVMKFCFSYDPEGRKYGLNITRIIGSGILILLIGFVIFLTIKRKKSKTK